jgi:hypothetical protein
VPSAYLVQSLAGNVLVICSVCMVAVAVPVRPEHDKAMEDVSPPSAPERDLSDAATLLLDQAEHELVSNTADAWLQRMSMPQAVFDALDAYLEAFGLPVTREAEDEYRWRRQTWLRRAMDNWHLSHDYRDDAGYPMAPLREGRRMACRRLLNALTDSQRGEYVARDLAEMSRLEWAMAIASGPGEAPHPGNLPPILVQVALDGYFADDADRALDGTVPQYPDLHLVSETVLRASIADYCPECPNPLQWSSGLPIPVKAALDALG